MARIVCLASSYKRGGRCVAGIHLVTGKWVRPIGTGHEGAIGYERHVQGDEPELLDILDVPIGSVADDNGCQPENVILKAGSWMRVGKMGIGEIMKYVENGSRFLLHNRDNKVVFSEFATSIPRNLWKSLQLIQVSNAQICKNPWNRLECRFLYNKMLYTLPATCPEADRLENQKGDFLLTISLGGPYRRQPQDEPCCWKMVAGVILLKRTE